MFGVEVGERLNAGVVPGKVDGVGCMGGVGNETLFQRAGRSVDTTSLGYRLIQLRIPRNHKPDNRPGKLEPFNAVFAGIIPQHSLGFLLW